MTLNKFRSFRTRHSYFIYKERLDGLEKNVLIKGIEKVPSLISYMRSFYFLIWFFLFLYSRLFVFWAESLVRFPDGPTVLPFDGLAK